MRDAFHSPIAIIVQYLAVLRTTIDWGSSPKWRFFLGGRYLLEPPNAMHLRTPLQKKLNAKCWLNPQKPDEVNEWMSVHALLASAPDTTRFCSLLRTLTTRSICPPEKLPAAAAGRASSGSTAQSVSAATADGFSRDDA